MTLAETFGPTSEGPRAPQRRCIVTGASEDKGRLLRFVVGPDGRIVPDIAERLPGRGLWLICRRDIVRQAMAKRSFERAARAPVLVDADLDRRIEDLLVRRLVDLIGLARRAGLAVQGFVKVRGLIEAGGAAMLIAAADGAEDGQRKLRALAPGLPLIEALSAAELGRAFGRESAVHAALRKGALATTLVREAERLGAYRAI
ncbi:MAG TPA: RNA-binding protein [Stellaceae bacterium]|nr:RNA-binding protein [Stellaceae bacterium]